MIYIYNEYSAPIWNISDKNDNFIRISIDTNTKFGIDIMKKGFSISDSYDLNIFKAHNTTALKVASCNAYGCYSNIRNGNTFMHTINGGDEFSNDLFLLTYIVPKGMKICKEKCNKFTLLYTFTEKRGDDEIINIIATAKPGNNPVFFLTFSNAFNPDEKEIKYVTKHLINTKKMVSAILCKSYTKEEAESSKYSSTIIGTKFIDRLLPSKVTHPFGIVVCPEEIKTICESKFHLNPEHTIYLEPSDPGIYNKLKKLHIDDHYSAATFYIDKDNADIVAEDLQCKYEYFFKKINFITKDGRIRS